MKSAALRIAKPRRDHALAMRNRKPLMVQCSIFARRVMPMQEADGMDDARLDKYRFRPFPAFRSSGPKYAGGTLASVKAR